MNSRLKNSIEVLQRAYLTEELEAGNCRACAVGNLVAASGYHDAGAWRYVFCTDRLDHDNLKPTQTFYEPNNSNSGGPVTAKVHIISLRDYNNGLGAIKATGYSVKELARIEFTFESAMEHGSDIDMPEHKSQWIRLQAVLKVLFDIEGISYDPEVEQPFLGKALS